MNARWLCLAMNCWPPFAGAGVRVRRIARDFSGVDVEMRLTWYNRNYVGTQFGGSLYSMTDPYFMLMLINNLGHDYIVWDKAAKIDFKKPGRDTVYAYFRLSKEQIAAIKKQADENPKYIFDLPVNVVDKDGIVIAEVIKTMYVRRKNINSAAT